MAKAKPAPKKDDLDRLAEGPERTIIALLLWKNRHRNPGLTEQITQTDLDKFRASCQYLDVTPEVIIKRPPGHPGSPGRPPAKNDPGLPPTPPEGPRPFVTVNLVDAGTENAIRPVENDEADGAKADEAREVRETVRRATGLAQTMLAELAEGTSSSTTTREAASALEIMAKALR